MNYKMVFNIIGKTLIIEAIVMLLPMAVGYAYGEDPFLRFFVPVILLLAAGVPLSFIRPDNKSLKARDGFVIVALCWVLLSAIGALPFVIGGEIPNYVNAFFETVSGFSTTGATILDDVEILSRSTAFWRILTHFIGGMGVLVFVIAILPNETSGTMYIFSAESPGPSASKIVGKMKYTARILYGIYVALTVIEMILLLAGGLGVYDSVLTAFSTAGTGGFGLHNGSIAYYNSAYVEVVISVFMFLFGVNFNVFYLIITGNVLKALKSEEFIIYCVMVFVATITISLNILSTVSGFGEALRTSFFQVAAITSTTGFSTADFDVWPNLSKSILLFFTVIGACGGSTGGGLKVSRLAILFKSGFADLKSTVSKRQVVTLKFESKPLNDKAVAGVRTFLIFYILIVIVSVFLLSFDSFAEGDIFTHLSASITCISNVGPGFNLVGPSCSFAGYSSFSKVILSVVMLAGRLEILPIIVLFNPKTWSKR